MVNPLTKLNLINFFIKKRDVDAGGVDTFEGDFSFLFSEITAAEVGLPSKDELKECLDLFKNVETVNKIPLISSYSISGQQYTISGCTTENLGVLKIRLERQIAGKPVDIVKVYISKTHGIYIDKITKLPKAKIGKGGITLLNLLNAGPKGAAELREATGKMNQALSKAKRTVNEHFSAAFNKPQELIIRRKAGGYILNPENYEFIFID